MNRHFRDQLERDWKPAIMVDRTWMSPSDWKALAELEARVEKLEVDLESVKEVNNLWDGR